ncbi:MAG: D-alanyl-D-alanine carboxypeptidase [Candidatus Pelagibacter bacterium]|nr:D-alanyl-D-alanine carboxypeptidase [Candidatus Pelagibacter bacterium]MBL6861161.1 D-alanyl-D-alanine carboxypeptidase [Candidatus Pelagibacter bacterium]
MNKLFILIILFIFSTKVFANPNIQARTGILIDHHSNEILYEMDPDIEIYPASMTKIMTAIVAFDLLNKGKLSLDDKFTISENAWRLSQAGYSSMFIMINDQVSVENLLKGIIIASGNDACVALAEGIAGSESNFAEMMNEKAGEIGMTSTNFANSSGINDPDNISTVRDIALMSKYLIQNYPVFYELFAEKTFTWDRTGGEPIKQGNRNPLLYKNIGVDGVKTGYLAVEKYSLASSMTKNDRRLIAVVSGFDTKNLRSSESLKLLNWGFRNTSTFEIAKKDFPMFELDTWLGEKNKIKVSSKEDYYVTINKKDITSLSMSLEYSGPIAAPIKKGEQVASITVFKKDEMVKSLPLYAAEDLKKVNFFKSLLTSLNYLIWGDV